MANYSFVSNAKFRPFSYQEMLQPLQAYTQEYNTIQEGVGELGAKADVFEKMANEQTDPQAYAMYKQYSNDLTQQAESLAKQGLTPASRQGLIDMKRRYSSEIIPIEQAYKRRQELVDEQRKLQAQDNTLLFDRPASTLSLDELIANPAISPKSYSGELLAKQVGTAAQNLAKEVKENPRKWRSILGNQYYETIMKKGFRSDEIMQAIQNSPDAAPLLRNIVEDAIQSSGIKNWGDEKILERAYDYAGRGLWNAIGTTEYQNLSNKAYDLKAAKGESYSPLERVPIFHPNEVSKERAKYLKSDNTLNKSVDRFYKQGKLLSKDEYVKKQTTPSALAKFIDANFGLGAYDERRRKDPQIGAAIKLREDELKKDYEDYVNFSSKVGIKDLSDFNEASKQFSKISPESYGALGQMRYRYPLDKSGSDILTNRLTDILPFVKKVEGANTDGTLKLGDEIDKDKLKEDGYRISQFFANPVTGDFTFIDNEGEEYVAPSTIFGTDTSNKIKQILSFMKQAKPGDPQILKAEEALNVLFKQVLNVYSDKNINK